MQILQQSTPHLPSVLEELHKAYSDKDANIRMIIILQSGPVLHTKNIGCGSYTLFMIICEFCFQRLLVCEDRMFCVFSVNVTVYGIPKGATGYHSDKKTH